MNSLECKSKGRVSIRSNDRDFRQSMDFINSNKFRNTIAFDYSPPSITRQIISKNNRFRNSLDMSITTDFVQHISYTKKTQNSSFHKLKNTLLQLQLKLQKAKKQLVKQRNVLDELDEDESLNQEFSIQLMVDSSIKANNYKGLFVIQSPSMSKGKICTESIKTFPSITTSIPYISSKIKTYYIEQLAKGISGNSKEAYQHLSISLTVIKSLPNFEPLSFIQIEQRKVCLSREEDDKRKTLVIDIDETIIHCQQEEPSQHYDLVVEIKLQNEQYAKAYISIRPYAISFLKKMSKIFQIVAFTASHKSYADVVLDEIDPNREFIKHRLYRHHCFEIHPNIYTKDLRIINRDLSQTVLVDNAPYSYIFQLQNGIPILPFYKGEDYQLPKLEKYLQEISQCKDVRQLNKQTFKFHQYGDFIGPQDLAKDLYFNNK